MKNSIKNQARELEIKLNEWYGCMPYEALSQIHFEDVVRQAVTMKDDKFEEYLDSLRLEWNELPIGQKLDIYDEISEHFAMFMPEDGEFQEEEIVTKVNYLKLFEDDFAKRHIWDEVCDVLNVNSEQLEVTIYFTKAE